MPEDPHALDDDQLIQRLEKDAEAVKPANALEGIAPVDLDKIPDDDGREGDPV